MKSNLIRQVIKYSIALAIATSFTIVLLVLRNYSHIENKLDKYRALSDSFVIPGVIFLMIGLLVVVSNWGGLTGIGFILKKVSQMFIPRRKYNHETYQDYLENRKKITGFSFILITGLIFFIIGIVFTILFVVNS